MPAMKRKQQENFESDSGSFSEVSADEYSDDMDITSALTNKRARTDRDNNEENDDDELNQLLHDTTSRRNIKGGTELIKKVKGGKNKLAKGEVGGGSFQSMGTSVSNSARKSPEIT